MRAIEISLVIGLIGAGVSRAWTRRLVRQAPTVDPHVPWVLGLLGLLPSWLIAFLGLLGSSPAGRLRGWSEAAFILSSAAALIGVIITEALVRRASESDWDRDRATYWRYGVASLVPAWVVSLLGYSGPWS